MAVTAALNDGHRLVGFQLAHEQFPVPQLVEIGAAAARVGFDLLGASDHFQPWQANEGHSGAAWVTLAALGGRTDGAWMGTTVTCPTLRYHPAIVAEAFASLAQLYPGRVFLGVGSGEALNEKAATGKWPCWRERWERLAEAIGVIRQLWSGAPVAHRGPYYTVKGRLYDPPAQPIPLLAAGNGKKAMRLAGKYGDGLITDPASWKRHKAAWQEGVREAGRNPAGMPVMIELYVVVGDEEEARAAAEKWRFVTRAFKRFGDNPDPAAIQHQAKADVPLEEVIDTWVVSADAAAHVAAIEKLFDQGATVVSIHSGQKDQQKVVDFYGGSVLPQLHHH